MWKVVTNYADGSSQTFTGTKAECLVVFRNVIISETTDSVLLVDSDGNFADTWGT